MKAVTWHGKRDVRVKDVRDPTIVEPTDLIVRVTSTGMCGSDLHLYEVLGPFLDAGDVLGHEAMGVVEEVGPDVTVVRTGDRVVVPFNISCGTCFMCSQGCSRSARRRRCTSTEPPRSSATRNSTGRCPADRPRLLVVESDSLGTPPFDANWSLSDMQYTTSTSTSTTSTSTDYKNHGDYVSQMGGGSENAQSPIGKPLNSKSGK